MPHHPLSDPAPAASQSVIGIVGSPRALTPAQNKFNELVKRISAQRQELTRWRKFGPEFQQHLVDHHQPALARLRDQQIAMARRLGELLEGKALDRLERSKAQDLLSQLLSHLLIESPEPDLVRLHDQYAGQSFSDQQKEDLDAMRALASEEFGVQIDAIPDADSPDELADWIHEQRRAQPEEPAPAKPRKKSAQAKARESTLEQAAEGGTRAVRELFRKLASELHPDRESDPVAHARKTELMQRVNQAYKAGDLLALLEVQLSIEQMDLAGLAGLAEERLRHYVHVLEGQSQRLRDELGELTAPFAATVDGIARGPGPLTPAKILRAVQVEIRQINALTREVQTDLVRFKNIQYAKQSLRQHRIDALDDGDDDPGRAPQSRRRRGKRRS